MNLPSVETPRIPIPVLSNPTVALPNVPVMSMPEVISVAETQLIGANPNIMKSGTQGHKMADVQISNTDTAHMPSAYAQLPTQALPPAPQQIPQVGAYYIPPQQLPSPTHVPLQNYAPSQQQIPVKEVVQPPVQQQVVNFSHNPVQTNPQNQQVNASLPAPQPYYPTYQNAAPYHNFVPMAQ
jgi:hypothetical protein